MTRRADLLKSRSINWGDFFSVVGAVFRCGRRGASSSASRLNGASSKSICGGNKRQSKMSLVFRQICNDFRFATFSTESAISDTSPIILVIYRTTRTAPPTPRTCRSRCSPEPFRAKDQRCPAVGVKARPVPLPAILELSTRAVRFGSIERILIWILAALIGPLPPVGWARPDV